MLKKDKKIVETKIQEESSAEVPESFLKAIEELDQGLTEDCDL